MNVIFDIEGLLLDFRPAVASALRAAARAAGGKSLASADAPELKPMSLRQLVARYVAVPDAAALERACDAYRAHFGARRLHDAVLHEGADELVALMRAGRGLSWHYLTTAGYWTAKWLIERHALPQSHIALYAPCRPLPPCVRTPALGKLLAMPNFAAAPNFVLSDYAEEIEQAADAGARAIGLRYGRSAAEVLSRAPTTHWAASCSDVAESLRRARDVAPRCPPVVSLPLSAALH